jgi:hypothetical protein
VAPGIFFVFNSHPTATQTRKSLYEAEAVAPRMIGSIEPLM